MNCVISLLITVLLYTFTISNYNVAVTGFCHRRYFGALVSFSYYYILC